MDDPLRQTLIGIGSAIADADKKMLRLAQHEGDDNSEPCLEAGRFLKLDGKRLGRDLELYGFMSQVMGWQQLLPMFLLEVIMPLKQIAPMAYSKGCEGLREMGEKVYSPELQSEWVKVLGF